MLGRTFCIQRGRVVYMTLSQPFLIRMANGLFLVQVGSTDYFVGDTIAEKVKHRSLW